MPAPISLQASGGIITLTRPTDVETPESIALYSNATVQVCRPELEERETAGLKARLQAIECRVRLIVSGLEDSQTPIGGMRLQKAITRIQTFAEDFSSTDFSGLVQTTAHELENCESKMRPSRPHGTRCLRYTPRTLCQIRSITEETFLLYVSVLYLPQ